MFIVSLHYIVDLPTVDSHMDAHVAWLKAGLADGWLLVAGRKVPRDGGILIARGEKADIEAKVATDPFVLNGVAEVTLTQFNPSFVADGLDVLKT
ncbi:YciI family protein [Sphingobium sp. HWE2-09]|jgi:uncharacterized protein YciI|uniref:YciI family protein n=1 Tax=Sphingobium sp. HWE2-09 TaxID=3108390 RepID=UPI002DCD1B01|nr:YciI family protein [Sphingobium sp. HWE2-09]